MDYDFNYFGGRDLVYPKTPVKPRLDPKADSTSALTYAQALAVYESEMISYREQRDEYSRQSGQRMEELMNRMRDDYALTQAQFDLLWDEAWDRGHSGGLEEVVAHFESLHRLAIKFAALQG